MKPITIRSSTREEMVEITAEVAAVLSDFCNSGPPKENRLPAEAGLLLRKEESFRSGICVLFTQHTTCGLTINENADPDVKSDMLGFLNRLIPQYDRHFRHFEHNSDAHIKSSLVGSSVTVPFESGKLCLGRWQGIYLCEFDGPRERTVLISIV
jgi:secondary thiamine-phosphate synthase enzyme